MTRLAVLASHPVQYYAPLFRELAKTVDLHVYYAHKATPEQQAAAGFGAAFDWDIDLTSGYPHTFLQNVSRRPGTGHFNGCDTPEIGRLLKEWRYTSVLALGWHLKSMLQGVLAARRLGQRVLIRGDSHLDTPRSSLKTWAKRALYPHFLRLFDVALYVGQRNRAYYEHYGFPKERMIHSPHCVDTIRFQQGATPAARAELRHRLGVGDATKLVLFAGKLVPFKRPLDVVDAVALARGEPMDLQILIAGSGPLESDLVARATERSVPLHRLGFQNQSQMPAVYAAADVLALPSNGRETWGLVCNEALASGLPIVVSDQVGCAPDLADGRAGWSFPMGDIEVFSTRLLRSVRSKDTVSIAEVSAQYSLTAAASGIARGAADKGVLANRKLDQ